MSDFGLDLHCRCFSEPRRGHGAGECQDACATDRERGRFAIADGAAESAHAGLWARLLVEGFVHGSDEPAQRPAPAAATSAGSALCGGPLGWPAWLAPLQQQWADAVRP